jgi:carbamoyltransferase
MVELLDAFEAETGVPIVINTSFNRHEQPIVATVDQSIEELRRGVVDALVLEDAIVEKPGA